MRLSHLTLTGADDAVDPHALARLSHEAPLIEWGLLFAAEHEGRARFPSSAWREAFYRAAPHARRAAHLCGTALLHEAAEAGRDHSRPLGRELRGDDFADGLVAGPYQRMQLNFDMRELPQPLLNAWVEQGRAGIWRRHDGTPIELITQHNDANAPLHGLFSPDPHATHCAVLFDASGGQGASPTEWRRPIEALRCGYAGGLGPSNLAAQLMSIEAVVGPGTLIWIDMEAKLRCPDDRFDLDRVRAVLDIVRDMAGGAPLLPGVRLVPCAPRGSA